ncbi:MAG TPA: S9 family peptidase [Candidatus Koribacter sp.]|jgi:dipeptidyl aminopeptidase/acylaminoacyl peptidase
MLSRRILLASFFTFATLPAFFAQQPSSMQRAAEIIDSMPKIKSIGHAVISPDGKQIASIVGEQVSVSSATGADSHTVTLAAKAHPRQLSWSEDGKRLAILADIGEATPEAQLWIYDGTAAKNLATLKGYAGDPLFSPDGTKLSVLFIEGMPRMPGPLEPMTPLAGVIDEKIYEQRITTVDLDSGAIHQVTPDDMYVYEYDWTRDGRGWIASAAHGSGDNNWWIARLYHADGDSGDMHEIYVPKLQICEPHVSPDGKSVAFIEGLMSDAGSNGGDIFIVPLSGGAAKNLTPGIKASPSRLQWTSDGKILFTETIDGEEGFGTVTPQGAITQLWKGAESIHGSFSADGQQSAVVRSSPNEAPELWVGPIGKWTKLTSLNENLSIPWGETKSVHWMNGPTRLQGWLTMPKEVKQGEKYPLVIWVHGGPSSACMANWNGFFGGPVSIMGYFYLCPNPRGSFGQGEAFTRGNVKDFGGGDYRDILAAIDALAKEYPIDTRRVGIAGHSYGGYMTMWAETQTTRFAAAVAGAGLSDWLSYYGLNDIDEWMIPFFGASVYDDPAVYAKSDPMHFVKHVKTPTLILVGDSDGEVPMEQSVEWWHALKADKVPTELVVYPHEGHAIGQPADRRDYTVRALGWFNEWFGKVK